jgi:site-specific recombinase XerC
VSQAAITPIQAPDTIAVNLAAFLRSLRAEHKSEKTIETYRESVTQLAAFLAGQGMPDDIRHLKREHVEPRCSGKYAKPDATFEDLSRLTL